MAHHLRAEDSPGTAPAAALDTAQTVGSAYKEAFNNLKPIVHAEAMFANGKTMGGEITLRLLMDLSERFPNSNEALLVSADLYLDAVPGFDYDKAIGLYDRILSRDQKNVTAYIGKGTALYKKVALNIKAGNDSGQKYEGNEPAQAIACVEAALKLDPNNFAALYNKAEVLRMLERGREAIKCYEKAAKIGLKARPLKGSLPDISEEGQTVFVAAPAAVCAWGGLEKYMIDNYLTVVVDGKNLRFISKDQFYISNDNDVPAFCNFAIGICYAQDDMRDYKTAMKYIDRAISQNSSVYMFYLVRAQLNTGMGNEDEALRDQENAKAAIQRIEVLGEKYWENVK
jgi:tetratricopeptide (TPR) repeat protein